jgi:hypothetical protein
MALAVDCDRFALQFESAKKTRYQRRPAKMADFEIAGQP